MSELPPTGWDDIATKKDLEVLEYKLTAALHRELRSQSKTFIAWTSGLTTILVAVFGWITTLATR